MKQVFTTLLCCKVLKQRVSDDFTAIATTIVSVFGHDANDAGSEGAQLVKGRLVPLPPLNQGCPAGFQLFWWPSS